MNSIMTALAFSIFALIWLVVPSPMIGAGAAVTCVALAGIAGFIISRVETDKKFLLHLFIGGLLIRVVVGTLIYGFELQGFFGGDAFTYDTFGLYQLQSWEGNIAAQYQVNLFLGEGGGAGWGMVYMVAALYKIVGQNMLATQFVNSVLGASTAVIIYLCAQQIFGNLRVSRVAGLFVAFFPSLILWSSQGLKDGPIVFLLALTMLSTLKLGEKFRVGYLLVLIFAMLGVLSLRFYIFYMLIVAITGAFVIGMRAASAQNFVRQFAVIMIIGVALAFFGISQYANTHFESYGRLDELQRSRLDSSRSADSGFNRDVDISTTSGVVTAIPVGLVYLLFAPFPWQLGSLRQSITLPEMLVWWSSFPLLVLGFWYTIKYRLRHISPILIFTTLLTLAYSVFEGNVGTAYRQRAQLLVFYFIFVSVGYVLVKEKRENRQRIQISASLENEAMRAGRMLVRGRNTGQYDWEPVLQEVATKLKTE
ncbi:MAG: glycosyltransferase family 39 protein [Pyrinomonadaceae bacterium]